MVASADVTAAAIEQVALGFAAFALRENAKVPVTEHGFKNATRNPDWVATQLQAPHAGNYGIVWPVDAPPVVVFDLDDGGGADTPWQDRLLDLIARNGPLPPTKSTTTPSGGRHAFYRWPDDVPIPPGDELFGFTVRWPGRGYLVGPGSQIDGRVYAAGPETVIAALPAEWVEAALREHPQRRPNPDSFITVTGGFQLPDRIPAGRRYATVRDYIASRYNAGLDEQELWELVRTQVAPLFDVPKDEATLRQDFDRAIAKITERLGPPSKAARLSPEDAVAAVEPIEVLNLADIAVEAVTWLWHRFLPVGSVTLFDGNPGEGKSTIVADIIARLTRGSEWPDGSDVGPAGTVLYITKEDDAATQVRPRIEAAGGDVRMVNFVAADLLFPRDTGRFREALDQMRPRLVLLDPLMSYLEGKVKVISDNEVRSALMTPLAETARAVGTCVLVIRHFNKGSGQTALMRGAGSLGGLAGAARMVLALTADPDDDDDRARVFGVVKSNYEAKPPSLKALIESAPVEGFQMTVSRVSWHGASESSVTDLMERTREEHQARADAIDDLATLLDPPGTKVPRRDIEAKLKGKHSKHAIYAARTALHVVMERTGFQGGTVWSMPVPLIRPNHPSDLTNGTNGIHPTSGHSYETPTNETDGTNDESPHSFIHSNRLNERVPPARARVREDSPPVVVPVDTPRTDWCHFPVDHRFQHRDIQTAKPWCEFCSPETGS